MNLEPTYTPLPPKTLFSDGLKQPKHCLLSRSPKSALRRTDGRRVPCRFLRRRCRRFQPNDAFFAVFSVVHIDFAVHHGKHFLAVVDVPFVGLVRPVQAHGGAVHIGDVRVRPMRREAINSAEADWICVSGIFRVSLILYLDKPS